MPLNKAKGRMFLEPTDDLIECACGCGTKMTSQDNWGRSHKFISGHNTRMRKNKNLKPIRHSEEHKKKMSERMAGVNNPQYKKERFIDERGYTLILCPNHPNKKHRNYIYEHRRVMEIHLGRFLENEEIVHHLNGNKSDNRIENLKLFSSHSEHTKYEAEKRRNATE